MNPESVLSAVVPKTRTHGVMTPEGVLLRFAVADPGDRITAFMHDLLYIVFLEVVAVLPVILVFLAGYGSSSSRGYLGAYALLVWFLIWNFYFVWFELRWQGMTPGKRRAGIRVIDVHGRPLTTDAVLTRNLTRHVEIYLPLLALLAPAALVPGAPAWASLLSVAWLVVLLLFPLFNRLHRRMGDVAAGTVVVRTPEVVLLPDLVASTPAASAAAAAESPYVFTDEQLAVYGIYELQVLEDVLRNATGPTRAKTLSIVAKKIRTKIRWHAPPEGFKHEDFLRAFYAALRAKLERSALLGIRKQDKADRSSR